MCNRFNPQRTVNSSVAVIFPIGLGLLLIDHSAPMLGQQKDAAAQEKSDSRASVTLVVGGTTCTACSRSFVASLRKTPGVFCSQVDYDRSDDDLL